MASSSFIVRIGAATRDFDIEVDKITKKTQRVQQRVADITKTSGALFVGFAAAIGGSIKAFADFETGLVGVGKTTGIAGKELDKLGSDIQKLSTTVPVATDELLKIGQSAGQLGVTGSDNILKFADTIAKLGRASDLEGEEAATTLTRILTVTSEGVDTIDNFASVIVALGNNFAASESEIARMTNEIARSISVFGASAAQSAALGTALRSIGVQAELGGTSVGKAFRRIDFAVRNGGAALESLSEITGQTGDQLKKTFEDDSTEVFRLFVEGLGRVQKEGGDVTATLREFGLSGEGILKTLPALAKNSSLLAETLKVAADEAANATALEREFAAASKTLENEFVLLKNQVTLVAQQIGTRLAPTISKITTVIRSLFKFLSENPVFTEIAGDVLLFGAGLTGLVTVLGTAAIAFVKLRNAVLIANTAIKAMGLSVRTLIGATGIGLVVLVLSDLALNWETRWAQMQAVFAAFSNNVSKIGSGLGQILAGIFTFDQQKVKDGLEELKGAFSDSVADFQEIRQQANQKELEDIDAQNIAKTEKALVQRETEKATRAIADEEDQAARSLHLERLRELEEQHEQEKQANQLTNNQIVEQNEAAHKANLEKLNNEFRQNQLNLDNQIALDKKKKEQADRLQFLQDEKKHGTSIAQLNQTFRSSEFQATSQAFGDLSTLTRSKNKDLFEIGKAAAIANAVVNVAQGVTRALASFPPPFSFIAAAAQAAAGGVQIATIASQKFALNEGGIVPGLGSNRDSVNILGTPGELMTPRQNFDEVVNSVADRRSAERAVEEEGAIPGARITLELMGELAEFVEAKIIERQSIGISLLPKLGTA